MNLVLYLYIVKIYISINSLYYKWNEILIIDTCTSLKAWNILGDNHREGEVYCWRGTISAVYIGFGGIWGCWTACSLYIKCIFRKSQAAFGKYSALWWNIIHDWFVLFELCFFGMCLLCTLVCITYGKMILLINRKWTFFISFQNSKWINIFCCLFTGNMFGSDIYICSREKFMLRHEYRLWLGYLLNIKLHFTLYSFCWVRSIYEMNTQEER